MIKIVTILSVALIISASIPAMGQSFLEKALKKVEKGLDKISEGLQPSQKQNSDSRQSATSKSSEMPQVNLAGFPTDLALNNVKGHVMKIVETYDQAKLVKTWEYSDDLSKDYGMLLRMKCEDNYGGADSYSGEVTCLHDMHGLIIGRNIEVEKYFDYNGTTYTAPEYRKYRYVFRTDDSVPTRVEVEEESESKTSLEYTYDDKWRLVRTGLRRWGNDDPHIIMIYIYDADGRVIEKHMDMYSEYPHEKFAYDEQGRITMHETPSDVQEFTYNDHGDVTEKKIRDKVGDEQQNIETYTYIYDKSNNWTQRISWSPDGAKNETVDRVITYY